MLRQSWLSFAGMESIFAIGVKRGDAWGVPPMPGLRPRAESRSNGAPDEAGPKEAR